MLLRDFLAEVQDLDRVEFLRLYATPHLVFDRVSNVKGAEPETRKLARTVTQEKPIEASGLVFAVKKTARNPYVPVVSLGRADNNDIIVADDTVSKSHAVFIKYGDQWRFVDQNTTNGTHLDGESMVPYKPYHIFNESKISIGLGATATFYMPEGLWSFTELLLRYASRNRACAS